jgi:hypothetical protein
MIPAFYFGAVVQQDRYFRYTGACGMAPRGFYVYNGIHVPDSEITIF